ncbi:c-type cytochrome [Falsiroseomonas sp. HW251]|uniref:c-type cytochrome n=1 Tax=Falsiroseomonas sp. HW251 TaxID=3390998 RepID=UPI003D323B13
MPASVKWLLLLLGLGVLAAGAAVGVQAWQLRSERRILAAEHTGGDVEAGRAAIERYGCGGCHRISGVPGASGRVGPPLAGLARRFYVAGRLSNRPAELILWISHPREADPRTAMPDLGVDQRDARDIAAYLLALGPPVP